MRKVSFDGGKTFIDPMDDETFHDIRLAVSKTRNWNVIIDAMEANTLLSLKLPIINLTSSDSKIRLLYAYLNAASQDLVVKLPKVKRSPLLDEDRKKMGDAIMKQLMDSMGYTDNYKESANYYREHGLDAREEKKKNRDKDNKDKNNKDKD